MNRKHLFTGMVLTVVVLSMLVVSPTAAVDHSLYETVLDRHVEGGFFDYKSFMNNRNSREKLDRYLRKMSNVDLSDVADTEALAYWMNLYNAATIKLIEQNYPVESIKDIGGWFSGPWSVEFVKTPRGTLTLDHIEHQIIRPEFKEPRIHFALVCAAKSCPPLRAEPYKGNQLDTQLEHQARMFINSSRNRFRIKQENLVVQLSSIFSWYGEDFGGESGVVRYLSRYLSDRKRTLIERGQYSVQYLEYKWSLNQAPGPYEGVTGSKYTSQ